MPVELDHLVVAARSLAEGADWCEATFGVQAQPGGRHSLMGTHNRLLAIGSDRYPRSYLEIIAIDPEAPAPGRPRWFDLDSPALQRRLAAGPCLVHWVARAPAIERQAADWRAAGYDPGVPAPAERMTLHGMLRWRITLRADGGRPASGGVPLLIEWSSESHPSEALPATDVVLQSIRLTALPAGLVSGPGIDVVEAPGPRDPPGLRASFTTRKGAVELATPTPSEPAPPRAPGN